MTSDLLARALELARKAHEGQTRRGLTTPYILHPVRVALTAAEAGLLEEAVAAALLHDVVEDSAFELLDLENHQFPPRTVRLVALLTKWWREADRPSARTVARFKREYYARIQADPDALALKILDRVDNLRDATRCLVTDRRWVERYVEKTQREFPGLVRECTNAGVVTRYHVALGCVQQALTASFTVPICVDCGAVIPAGSDRCREC